MYNHLSFGQLIFSHVSSATTNTETFFRHLHAEYELLFIVKGDGSFIIENESFAIKPNSIFLIPPFKYHVAHIAPLKEYERFYIIFPQELFPSNSRTEETLNKIIGENIASLFYKTDRYADIFSRENVRILLHSLLSEILILLLHENETKNAERKKFPHVIKRVIDFIGDNIEKPLPLDEIAANNFVSKSYLSHLFYKTMNISVARYVRLKKMHLAQNLLSQNYSATYVATYLGYQNYSVFLRNYKAEFGKNPSSVT